MYLLTIKNELSLHLFRFGHPIFFHLHNLHQWEKEKFSPKPTQCCHHHLPSPKADDVAVGKANRRVLKESIQATEGFFDHERPWIFSFVLRVETPPIMKVKAIDKGFFDIWYMREMKNLKMIALYIINLALRKLIPVTLWVSLYVSFKSQGTLNLNTSLKKGLMASAVLLEKQPIVMFKPVKV